MKFSILGIDLADKGYYINLDKSKDRKSFVDSQIKKYKIKNLHRFPALTHKPYHGYGATKSHLKLFEDFLNSDLETIFVGEDDFDIRDNTFHPVLRFQNKFKDSLEALSKDMNLIKWDLIMLGCNPRTRAFSVSETLSSVSKSTGAWAYIINRKAAECILNNLHYNRDYLAIDDWLPRIDGHNLTCLMSNELIIHHAAKQFKSEIQTNLPITNYDNMIQGGYELALHETFIKGKFLSNHVARNVTIVFNFDNSSEDLFNMFQPMFEKNFPKELFVCPFIFNNVGAKDFNPYKHKDMPHWLKDYAEYSYALSYKITNFESFQPNRMIKTSYFLNVYPDYDFSKYNKDDLKKCKIDFSIDKFIEALNIKHSPKSPKPKIKNNS